MPDDAQLRIDDTEFEWFLELTNDLEVGDYENVINPSREDAGYLQLEPEVPFFRFQHAAMHGILHMAEFSEEAYIEHETLDKIARYLARLFEKNPALVQFLFPAVKRRAQK